MDASTEQIKELNKRCTKCTEVKPESEFSFSDKSEGVRKSQCKSCDKKYDKKYRKENKEQRTKYYEKNKESIKEKRARRTAPGNQLRAEYLLTHHCVDCGESDPIVLEFDHVHGEKVLAVSAMITKGYPLETIKTEMAKCEVRCAHCHKRRHVKERQI